MNVATVMDELAAQLDTISGLRVFAFPPDTFTPPAGIVDFPDTVTFDETYGRGMDSMVLPVWVVVGRVSDRATKKNLAAYANGTGAKSIKAVIESGTYTAFDTVRVTGADFDVVTENSVDYRAARFDLDIAGQGGT